MALVDEVGLVVSATKPVGLSRVTGPERHCSFVGFARGGLSQRARTVARNALFVAVGEGRNARAVDAGAGRQREDGGAC